MKQHCSNFVCVNRDFKIYNVAISFFLKIITFVCDEKNKTTKTLKKQRIQF